ncbi:MAG: prophage antirepressor [Bacilli bacterium]|nr:prophage antirepressor [Bacilli bacterium]
MLTQIFMYEGAQVRTVMIEDQPWLVAKDLCDILEVGNTSQALSRLDDDEKSTLILNDGTDGNPNKAIVNEYGMYSLILGSRKPEAKAFKRWVTHEVLPAIRKTGSYTAPEHPIEDGIIHALQGIKQIKEENAQLKLHQAQQTSAITELKLVVDNEIWLTETQKAEIQEKVKNRCGVLQHMGYQSSFQGVYSALKSHFNVPKYDKIPRKDYERALDFVRGWYPKKQAK